MTPEQIRALAKQAGGCTYNSHDAYPPITGTWLFNTDELTEVVRLVREQAFKEAAQFCKEQKYMALRPLETSTSDQVCMSIKDSVSHLAEAIGRMK